MTNRDLQNAEDDFVKPGTIDLSPAAFEYARDFGGTVSGRNDAAWVVTFDWAEKVAIREGPGQALRECGPCLMLGAYRRDEVPKGFIQTVDRFEFAIRVPSSIREKKHLIDVDPALLFKLVLR